MKTTSEEIIKKTNALDIVKKIMCAISFLGIFIFGCSVDTEGIMSNYIMIGLFFSIVLLGISLLIEHHIVTLLITNNIDSDYSPLFFWYNKNEVINDNYDDDYYDNNDYYQWLCEENLDDTTDNYRIYCSKYIA